MHAHRARSWRAGTVSQRKIVGILTIPEREALEKDVDYQQEETSTYVHKAEPWPDVVWCFNRRRGFHVDERNKVFLPFGMVLQNMIKQVNLSQNRTDYRRQLSQDRVDGLQEGWGILPALPPQAFKVLRIFEQECTGKRHELLKVSRPFGMVWQKMIKQVSFSQNRIDIRRQASQDAADY